MSSSTWRLPNPSTGTGPGLTYAAPRIQVRINRCRHPLYGIYRTNRQKTGEARVPKGKDENVTQSLGDFRKLRATMTEFAKRTQEDLRGRQLKGGNMDVYQWLLMISTHSQRHILQVREVKAHGVIPGSREQAAVSGLGGFRDFPVFCPRAL